MALSWKISNLPQLQIQREQRRGTGNRITVAGSSSLFAGDGEPSESKLFDLAARLASNFAGRNSPAGDAVRTLYGLLCESPGPEIEAAFRAWRVNFAQIGGPDLDARRPKLARLAAAYGIDAVRFQPAELLFSLHSYFALVVKCVGRMIAGGKPDAPIASDPFDWIHSTHDDSVAALADIVSTRIDSLEFALSKSSSDRCRDLFQPLYEKLFPKSVRHALGEYYTPAWLAEHVLDELGYDGNPHKRLLDPACGSGIFLLAAIRRIRARHERQPPETKQSETELRRLILSNVVGCDLNPLAVLAARTNVSFAVADLPADGEYGDPSIHLCDSILAPPALATFDFVAGNPPWVAWDNLPADYREATKPLWEAYGLFSLSGTAARHGGGKKDLSMLMLYAAADRFLDAGGRLGFVMTQTILQTGGAGDGFRRFRLGEGAWLGVTRVDDFIAVRPFDAANWTCAMFLKKGNQTSYPVPYYRWTVLPTLATSTMEECHARPIDAQRPNSPWLIEPVSLADCPAYVTGPSDYVAHLGANSGGANGVFWVRILQHESGTVLVENLVENSKKPVPRVRQWLEADLLYPLARWCDVSHYRITPSAHILLAQDPLTRTGLEEDRLRRDFPLTYSYLQQFEPLLRQRAAYKRYQGKAPFYSMYDVGDYTLAAHKVVWRRMDKRLTAAVASETFDPLLGARPMIPQETCVLVACDSSDEAHYLCALLNSEAVQQVVAAHSVRGGKGFGTPGMMAYLNLRRFDAANARHQELVAQSRAAHAAASEL